jgi:plasmid stability protein
MAQVLIRDIPAEVVKRLKRRAAERGRSLQRELKQVLIDAARMESMEIKRLANRLRRQLSGRTHSDSTQLQAEDRRR